MEMREIYAEELGRLMEENENIVAIDADLARANGTLPLRDRFPGRAIDVGIAEQNMIGIAAGLSSYGFIPFVGSFAVFASRRAADQIMLSGCYAHSNIKIVGSDPGIAADLNGGTHMAFEDIGVLRSFPELVIFEAADGVQLRQAVRQIAEYQGPVYIRLFRKEWPDVFPQDYVFDLFRADTLSSGTDVTIAATGIMLKEAMDAAALLLKEGISAEVLNIHTIKPIDQKTLLASAKKTGCVVTAENHNLIGGLYSAVTETLAPCLPVPVLGVGVHDRFGQVGKFADLREEYGLTAEKIISKVKEALALKQKGEKIL